jgi:regulatory protein
LRVTRIRPVARPPGFVAIEVDGARRALLPVEKARELGLEVDRVLDDALAAEIERAGAAEAAYRAAVRLLAAHDRSVQEIMSRLRRKGLRPDVIAEAVGRLEVAGVLHDGRFAERFARARLDRGFGRARILADLAARGVERRVAENAVNTLDPGSAEQRAEQVESLARARASRLRDVPIPTARRRLLGFLMRRGFGGAEAIEAVDTVLREAEHSARAGGLDD